MTTAESRLSEADRAMYRLMARRAAAHVAMNASKATGVPVSALVREILHDEAEEALTDPETARRLALRTASQRPAGWLKRLRRR